VLSAGVVGTSIATPPPPPPCQVGTGIGTGRAPGLALPDADQPPSRRSETSRKQRRGGRESARPRRYTAEQAGRSSNTRAEPSRAEQNRREYLRS